MNISELSFGVGRLAFLFVSVCCIGACAGGASSPGSPGARANGQPAASPEPAVRSEPEAPPKVLKTKLLEGPFEAPTAFCPDPESICVLPGDADSEALGLRGPSSLGPLAPYEGVQVIGRIEGPFGEYAIAVKLGDGWYIGALDLMTNSAVSGASTSSASIESLAYASKPSGALARVALVFDRTRYERDPSSPDAPGETTSQRELVLCAITSTGKPACSEPLTLEESFESATKKSHYALGHELLESGQVRLLLQKGDAATEGKRAGLYALELP